MSSGKSRGVTTFSDHENLDTQYNPFRTDAYFVDWSERNGVYVLTNWSDDIVAYPTLSDFLDHLSSPSTIILESSWESYHLDRRPEILAQLARAGHVMLTIPPQETGRERKRFGIPTTAKSDSLDVGVIRHIAMKWAALRPHDPSYGMKVAGVVDKHVRDTTRQVVSTMVKIRTATVRHVPEKPRANSKFADGSVFHVGMDTFYSQLLESGIVPDLDTWDPATRAALSNQDGTEYTQSIVTTLAVMAVYVDGRRLFDRVSGLHVNARPSMVRSQLIWHGGSSFNGKSKRVDGVKQIMVEAWSTRTAHRAACRRLYRAMLPHRERIETMIKDIIDQG